MSMSGFPPKRILVVDDEPLVCDAVRMMLAFDGHMSKPRRMRKTRWLSSTRPNTTW